MRRLRVFFVLGLAAILVAGSALLKTGQSSANPNNDSLVGYWKFDEPSAGTAADSSGDGHDGTATGTTAVAYDNDEPTSFTNSHSLEFNGSGDVVTVSSDADLNPSTVTVSAWVRVNSFSGIQTILAKWDVGSQQQYVLQIQDNDVYFYVGDGSTVDSDAVAAVDAISDGDWHHLAGSYDGTNLSVYVDNTKTSHTSAVELGSSDEDLTIGAKTESNTDLFEFLDGGIDDIRVYGRALSDTEISSLASGDYTGATWTGAVSADYDVAGNWDIDAVPDPFTDLVIAGAASNQPAASSDIAMHDLSIAAGARLYLNGYNLTINDGGVFSNSGTLQLRGTETLTGFTNDTDSGSVLYTLPGYETGLAAGNSYNDLHFNVYNLAHWPLDSALDDVSGFENSLTANGDATYDTNVPNVHFADTAAAEFDGAGDYYSFDPIEFPASAASICAWVYPTSGTGTILGSAGSFALALTGGNEISVHDSAEAETASWETDSLLNAWHHICVIQTEIVGTSLDLYVDGVQVGTSEMLTNGAAAVDRIGSGSAGDFTGLIDDVRLYDRALDSYEVGILAGGDTDITVYIVTLTDNLDVNGDLVFSGGKIDVDESENYSLDIGGDLLVYSGNLDPRGGTVTLDGADQAVSSSLVFYNLTKNVINSATLTFGQGSLVTVGGTLDLQGASGQPLALRSSREGTQWNLSHSGSNNFAYLDVKDSNNLGSDIDITGSTITDSGNNDGWVTNVAPNTPMYLGPSAFATGVYTGDATPNVTFDLSDDNAGDSLKYQIQFDNNSDFSSPEIDYTSALSGQGSRNFTVGQAEGGGTYNTGSASTELTDGNWYWQVRAIDDYAVPHESDYMQANVLAISFILDTTEPTTPGTPTSASTHTTNTPNFSYSGSSDGGSGLAAQAYHIQWSQDETFNTDVEEAYNSEEFTDIDIPYAMSDGTWYVRVNSIDAVGNESDWAVSAAWVIDTTDPTDPGTPTTPTPTADTTPTWTWAASTDANGLDNPAYEVQWSDDNFATAADGAGTVNTNSYTHSTALAGGTWYFRVKATDVYGLESDWSSAGSVQIDDIAPSTPATPTTTTPTTDTTPAWDWTNSTDSGGAGLADPAYTVQWSQDNTFGTGVTTDTSASSDFVHTTPLADGTWYFRAKAKDNLNNESAYSSYGTVVIDATAPSVPGSPTITSPTADTTPTFSWSAASDGSGVGLDDTNPYTVQWANNSEFSPVAGTQNVDSLSYTPGTGLAAGTWYFRVRANDSLGNQSEYTTASSVIIDPSPPSNPGTPSTASSPTDNTPTWTWDVSEDEGVGLADPAYTVQWSQDNTFGTGVSTGTAAAATYTNTVLEDGTWYFRVKAADSLGNETSYSSSGQITIDTTAPTTPGTPGITTPTADSTPSWSWSAATDEGLGLDEDEPYTVEWSDAEDFSGSVTQTVGANSFTHDESLTDGTWYFRVTAKDKAGNISTSSTTATVFVDTTAPTAPGTPSTTTPTTDSTPTISWDDSDDGSGVGLAATPYTVELSTASDFSADFESHNTATSSYVPGSDLADGIWYFRVKAKDGLNNTSGYSASGNVQIDDTAPSTPGAPTTPSPTADTTPTWDFSASTDNYIGLAATPYTVQWSTDNTFNTGVSTDTVDTNQYTHASPLASGTWYFRVRASDSLGNTSEYSSVGSVQISTSGPTAPGTPSAATPTSNNLPTWTWSESTSPAGLANPAYYVEWSQDNTFNTGVSSETVNTEAYTHVTPLSDGTWYFRVKAEDLADIFSSYSSNGSVFIDTTGPSTPDEPTAATPTADSTPSIDWSDSTDAGGVGLAAIPYTIEWSQDSSFNTGVASATASASTFTPGTALADGTWYFRVKAKDNLDNESSFGSYGTVVVDTTAPSAPGVPSATSPTADNTPAWGWAASSDDGGTGLGSPAYEVQWSMDNTFGTGVSSDASSSTSYTHSSTLTDGTWYFRVRAKDEVNNASNYSSSGTVIIDTVAPGVPTAPATASPTADTTPTWSWGTSSDGSGTGLATPAYEVQWSQDNTFNTGVSSGTANSTTYTHGSVLAEGTWYFRVRAKDAVSNTSAYSAYGTVSIDTTGPASPGTPSTTTPTADTTPTWTWTGDEDDDGYTVQWSQDNTFNTGISNNTAAAPTYTHGSALAEGTWYFRVKSEDALGNESGWSSYGTVVIDTTGPSAPGTPSSGTPVSDNTPTWTWSAGGTGTDAYTVQWSLNADFSGTAPTDTSASTSYTHVVALSDGTWHFRVRALDALGNPSAWSSAGQKVINAAPPEMSGIAAAPTADGAVITWTSNESASTQVHYSIGPALDQATTETDKDGAEKTSHTATITGVRSCATVQYQVSGSDVLGSLGQGTVKSFTTGGCAGNAAVAVQTSVSVSYSAGGTASLSQGTANVALSIPANFAAESAEFQLKQLVTSTALSATGKPSGFTIIGNHLYDLKAMTAPGTSITSFNNPLTVIMTYATSEVSGFDLSSLLIYRWDGSSWQQTSGCSVNAASRTVTCTTSGFSVFGLFGKATVPVQPSPDPEIILPDETDQDDSVTDKPVYNGGNNKPVNSSKIESASDKHSIGTALSDTIKRAAQYPGWILSVLLFLIALCILWLLGRRRKDKKNYGIHKDD